MLHSKLPLRKQKTPGVQLKRFFYLLSGVLLVSITACNNSNPQNPELSKDSTKAAADTQLALTPPINSIDTKLYVLYLKNYKDNPTDSVNNELERLLPKNRSTYKIVFQLYQPEDGILSLSVYNGVRQKGHTDFLPDPIILNRSETLPGTDYDMAGKNVAFGSWEISIKKKDSLSKLINLINDPKAKYILFTPQLTKIAGTNNYNIVYDVGYDTVIQQSTNKSIVPLNILANPSPPRQAY